jgi:hypothetical protein
MIEGKYIALMAIASSAATAVIVWAISDAIVRYAEIKRRRGGEAHERELAERLSRIESSIDAMSMEVERIGEMQRFLGRLPSDAAPDELRLAPPTSTGRVITPH